MVRRIAAIVLVLLGAVSIVLGVLSATAWRTSDVVSVTSTAIDTPLVVVDPGVPTIVNDSVEVTVKAATPEQAVTVIEGRDVDVIGWIADGAYQRITGLPDWDELSTEVVEGVAEVPSPVGNDMWLSTQQGTGELTWTMTATDERIALLIPRDGATGPAPTVTFTWSREVATPYRDPLVGGGIAGIVVGLALGAWSIVAGRRRKLAADQARIEAERVAAVDAAKQDPESTAILAPTLARQAEQNEAELPPAEETLTRRQRRALAATTAAAAAAAASDKARTESEAGEGSESEPSQSQTEPEAAEELVAVEDIATAITAAPEEAGAPDSPEAYPAWLRTAEGEPSDPAVEVAVDSESVGVSDEQADGELAEVESEAVEGEQAEAETDVVVDEQAETDAVVNEQVDEVADEVEQAVEVQAVEDQAEMVSEGGPVEESAESAEAIAAPVPAKSKLANLRGWRPGKGKQQPETKDEAATPAPSAQTPETETAESSAPDEADEPAPAANDEGEHLAADASAWRRRWGVSTDTSETSDTSEATDNETSDTSEDPEVTNEEGQN